MAIDPREKPVSLQLFGSDPDIISEMAKRIEEKPFDILDINMGCPVPKVVNNGEGSALMKNPVLVSEILTKTVKAGGVACSEMLQKKTFIYQKRFLLKRAHWSQEQVLL
jgi:tRNA-dihydrouridine synthase